jgi:flagellar biosynthesis GTPase FlhF
LEDASQLLDRFLNAKPGGKFIWIAGYKPLAQKYAHDCQLYAAWKKEGNEAKDAASVAKHEQNTRDIVQKKKFETRTVFSEEVVAAERNMGQQAADQQKAESAVRERERKKKAEQAAQQSAQLATQKKPLWLADWKKTLIDDFNRTHFAGTVTDRTGQRYSGIVRATADNLTMQLPYGEAQLPWAQLAPQTLLSISTSFVKANAPDAADRKWLSAVFAAETGQLDAARKLAEDAAAAKPEYRDQIAPLLGHSPTPAPR